ncbi:MAG: HEAT repeat domain-containing protein [Sedimentisphaerales bacterium]|nr:HEAT repeat domain-containing protein [Sedimentisphaerales bacterium]
MSSQTQKYLSVVALLGLLAVVFSGCAEPLSSGDPLADLNDEYAPVRIAAIKYVAENHVTEAVPRLVSLLLHDDGVVRFYAIQALREITGKDHGYRYSDDAASRAAAVDRWYNDEEIFGNQPVSERSSGGIPII